MSNHAPIGTASSTAEFREMTMPELTGESFSDYFRFSFTIRMDRDEAIVLRHKVEALVEEMSRHGLRVYLGVKNR